MSSATREQDHDAHDREAIARVEAAVAAIARGEMVILVDDEDRENEGDLVMAAEKVTPEAINFMALKARGLICLAMTRERLDDLQVPMMVTTNNSPYGTAFAVSIEARTGVTTGISAADRARTIQVAVAEETRPQDLVMPGHVFPLRARAGGVLVRTGQTEGSVDLARLAGLKPSAVICEIMNDDGTMARAPELEAFGRDHDLLILSVADVIAYRLQRESLVELVDEAPLTTEYPGQWRVRVYRSRVDGNEHLCFVCGEPQPEQPTLVRVQYRCDTFDIFTRRRSEGIENLRGAMAAMSEEGSGVIVYLDRRDRGATDLLRKYVHGPGAPDASAQGKETNEETNAPAHHDESVNRPKDILRDLGIGAQILVDAGVGKMRVMTNRPKKIIGTDAYGLEVVEQVPIPEI